jgi:hypothetical protein
MEAIVWKSATAILRSADSDRCKSLELMGIEPTASRVRWHGDGPVSKDFAELERQQAPESVPERPILATCSQNSEAVDPVSSQLEDARREWSADRDARRLRRALLVIMGLLDG